FPRRLTASNIRSIITEERLWKCQRLRTVSNLWWRHGGALHMQVLLTHRGQQATRRVVGISSNHIVRAASPIHGGTSNASKGERSHGRTNLNIAQGGFLNPRCQPVAII